MAINSSANIKLSKRQISKIIKSCGYLGRPLGSLLKIGLPLTNNVLRPLVKSVLIPLGLTAAASAAGSSTQKKIFGSGATLIISNKKMEDMKTVKPLDESGSLRKGAGETIENYVKEQKGGFLGILLGTLRVTRGAIWAGEGTTKSVQIF